MSEKRSVGRPRLSTEQITLIAIKCDVDFEARIKSKVFELRRAGFKTNKSELIRVLTDYWLSGANDIYAETMPRKEANDEPST